ncbi:ABC transporter ATP-binding protein [Spirochaetota bacterium]
MISIRNVTKKYDTNCIAVNNISLTINEGEICVLLGTSGCGKTTTLKMINRLVDYDLGEIYIQKKEIKHFDPIMLRRSIGYVIQSIGLFPHMTIKDNISIIPDLLNWDTSIIETEIRKVLEIIKLSENVLMRYPHQLSGGQKQRVGVARALIADPKIILMDEPFGALDPITREELQEEFKKLQLEIKKTIVFVTHDIFEAFSLADKIALMDCGNILQFGQPVDFLINPKSEHITRFIGKHKDSLLSKLNCTN